jgi:hypothetical protein
MDLFLSRLRLTEGVSGAGVHQLAVIDLVDGLGDGFSSEPSPDSSASAAMSRARRATRFTRR